MKKRFGSTDVLYLTTIASLFTLLLTTAVSVHVADPVPDQDTPARPDITQPFITQQVTATAYCPCEKCCGQYADNITASGKSVWTNGSKFIAAPSYMPFYTWVIVPGYNDTAVPVLDRGGAIKDNRIDVFFPTHQEALEWGVQEVTITIFHPSNEE